MNVQRDVALTGGTAGPVAYHAQLAEDWERRYRKHSFHSRKIVLAECLELHDLTGTTWLDAGCGAGTLSRWLAERGCQVLGVDAAPEMVRMAAQLTEGQHGPMCPRFVCIETIARLDLDARSLDGVLCSSVLEYVPDPSECLQEFARVLKPGGMLLVSVPNHHSIVRKAQVSCRRIGKCLGRSWLKFIEYSRHEYTVRDFTSLLQKGGFSVEMVRPFGSPLPRWLQRMRIGGSLLMFEAKRDA